MSKSVTVFGASWCPFCQSVRSFLDRNSITYTFRDVDAEGVRDEMKLHTPGNEAIPVVIIEDEVAVNPELAWLCEKLDIELTADNSVHDVVAIGAGPAALSAAIYTTREDLDTVLIEKGVVGGLAAITDQVDNYPGFPEGVTGMALAESLEKQAVRFGTKFEYGEVTAIENRGEKKRIITTTGELFAKTVLIATGSDWKKLGIPGEKEFYGRGVHYCATCDGPVYRDKNIVVVGGGNSAVQESIFLTKFVSHIDMLVRGDTLRASEVLQHELAKHSDKITVHYNTVTNEILSADGKLVSSVSAAKAGQDVQFECSGVFVFIGLQPTTGFLKHTIELDEFGFVKTDHNLETSMEGVFAAGDVRSGATMQIASAVGEGATAALKIREHIKEHHTI
jgi:thioredoxin reductase (NADPH)